MDKNDAVKTAIDPSNHIDALTSAQTDTFSLLAQLKTRLNPVSSLSERVDAGVDAMPAPIATHLSFNVDNARQINNMVRNLLNGLEI